MIRAAVTGWGLRTPLGDTAADVVRRLLQGERAAKANDRFDARSFRCHVAATIPSPPRPSKHRKFLRRMGLFALEAAHDAAGSVAGVPSERVGVFFATGGLRAHWDDMMGALERQRDDGQDAWARGLGVLHPFFMLQHLSNNAHALFATDIGAHGEGATYAGANAGAQALAAAIRALAASAVDRAIVVAHDTLVEPETIVELAERGAAACVDLDRLRAPYDERASGIVPGEGAAAVVLERPGDAADRALALIAAADGADGTADDPRVGTIADVLRGVVGDAPRPIVVDGASTARPAFDAAERAAVAEITGADAPLVSLASATGALGATTAVFQVIALAALLREGALPPIAGLSRAPLGPLRPLVRPTPTDARIAIGASAGAPGLAGAVRVEVP